MTTSMALLSIRPLPAKTKVKVKRALEKVYEYNAEITGG